MMRDKKILLIGKAGIRAGIGHLSRLCAIYRLLKPFYHVNILINKDKAAFKFLSRRGIKFAAYKDDKDIPDSARNIHALDMTIIDMPHVTARLMNGVKKSCGNMVVFDDLRKYREPSIKGIRICPQETFRSRIKSLKDSVVLEGSDYFILDSKFQFYRKKKRFKKEVKNVLVCMGGIPPVRQMAMITRLLDESLNKSISLHIVSGYVPPARETYSKRVIFHRNSDNIAALIAQADMGIISGGFVKFECMCLGTPYFILSRNDHQQYLAEKFSSKGYGIYLGRLKNVKRDSARIRSEIERLIDSVSGRKKMFVRFRRFMDGNGGRRFVSTIRKYINTKKPGGKR